MADHTRPDDTTRAEEQREAKHRHDAGEEPTPEEAAAADRHSDLDPTVGDAYEDALERGADQQGEGRPGR